MKPKIFTNEFRVGLFIVACLLGLFYMTYSTGKLDLKEKGYYITVVFKEAGGLQKKAPVLLNGFEVGKVDSIAPIYENDKTAIALKIWMQEKAKIREGSKFSIQMMGMMGEKYVQISSSDNGAFVVPDSVLSGDPYVDLSVLIVNLNKAVEDNRGSFNHTVKNFETTSDNFLEFSDDLKRNPWKLLFKTKEKPRVVENQVVEEKK